MMTKKTEALKMALRWFTDVSTNNEDEVIQACKEALAQPAQGFDEFWRDNAQPWYDYDTARDFWQASRNNLEQPVVMERDYNFMCDLAIGCEDAWNELHKQEPVAVVAVDNFGNISVGWNKKPQHNDKLYTHPAPSWQGLSDDEILIICAKMAAKLPNKEIDLIFARAIETKLKEKNNAV